MMLGGGFALRLLRRAPLLRLPSLARHTHATPDRPVRLLGHD
jgi:hypothetical protein